MHLILKREYHIHSKSTIIKRKLFWDCLRWISWSFIRCFLLIYCVVPWLKIFLFHSIGQLVYNHQKCNIRNISYCYVYDEKYPRESFIYRLYPVNSYETSGQSIHSIWDISEQITFELTWEMKVPDKSIYTCLLENEYNVII